MTMAPLVDARSPKTNAETVEGILTLGMVVRVVFLDDCPVVLDGMKIFTRRKPSRYMRGIRESRTPVERRHTSRVSRRRC